jgi:hypothetical protein
MERPNRTFQMRVRNITLFPNLFRRCEDAFQKVGQEVYWQECSHLGDKA